MKLRLLNAAWTFTKLRLIKRSLNIYRAAFYKTQLWVCYKFKKKTPHSHHQTQIQTFTLYHSQHHSLPPPRRADCHQRHVEPHRLEPPSLSLRSLSFPLAISLSIVLCVCVWPWVWVLLFLWVCGHVCMQMWMSAMCALFVFFWFGILGLLFRIVKAMKMGLQEVRLALILFGITEPLLAWT